MSDFPAALPEPACTLSDDSEQAATATSPGDFSADPGATAGRQGQLQCAIAALVKDLPKGEHLTAPEVFRRARACGLKVSLSTVYRVLNQLQAHGNVSTVAGEHGKRYEAHQDDREHDHLICLKCDLTIEFSDDLISGFGKAVAERKGYEHRHSRFDIFGICNTCKASDEDHKIETAIGALENALSSTGEATAILESAITQAESRKLPRARQAAEAAVVRLREAIDELLEVTSLT